MSQKKAELRRPLVLLRENTSCHLQKRASANHVFESMNDTRYVCESPFINTAVLISRTLLCQAFDASARQASHHTHAHGTFSLPRQGAAAGPKYLVACCILRTNFHHIRYCWMWKYSFQSFCCTRIGAVVYLDLTPTAATALRHSTCQQRFYLEFNHTPSLPVVPCYYEVPRICFPSTRGRLANSDHTQHR